MRSSRNDMREGNEILLEADSLRIENQQLYRLVLQLIADLDELEDVLSAAQGKPASSTAVR